MSAPLPVAVWSGEMKIGPVTLKCHTLDDGRRIIEDESFAAFCAWLADDGEFTMVDCNRLAAWLKGQDQ